MWPKASIWVNFWPWWPLGSQFGHWLLNILGSISFHNVRKIFVWLPSPTCFLVGPWRWAQFVQTHCLELLSEVTSGIKGKLSGIASACGIQSANRWREGGKCMEGLWIPFLPRSFSYFKMEVEQSYLHENSRKSYWCLLWVSLMPGRGHGLRESKLVVTENIFLIL